MSKVMMRFPLWEGSWDSGIPSPVTTLLYAGLMCCDKQIRDRKIVIDADDAQTPKDILLEMSLFKCTVLYKVLEFVMIISYCLNH